MDLLSHRFNETMASANFLVLSAKAFEQNDGNPWNMDIDTVRMFWPMSGICLVPKDLTVCSKREYTSMIMRFEVNDCDQNQWSSFFYDMKTNW